VWEKYFLANLLFTLLRITYKRKLINNIVEIVLKLECIQKFNNDTNYNCFLLQPLSLFSKKKYLYPHLVVFEITRKVCFLLFALEKLKVCSTWKELRLEEFSRSVLASSFPCENLQQRGKPRSTVSHRRSRSRSRRSLCRRQSGGGGFGHGGGGGPAGGQGNLSSRWAFLSEVVASTRVCTTFGPRARAALFTVST